MFNNWKDKIWEKYKERKEDMKYIVSLIASATIDAIFFESDCKISAS